jgi:hypothetical protein
MRESSAIDLLTIRVAVPSAEISQAKSAALKYQGFAIPFFDARPVKRSARRLDCPGYQCFGQDHRRESLH